MMFKYPKVSLLIFLGLLIQNSFFAQNPLLQQYTVKDGLPTSNIYTALEDQNGMMYFGTDKGLIRFDGYRFKVYNPSEVNGSSDIWGLAEDLEGRIWCSTFNNALYFQKDSFYLAKTPKQDFPQKIIRYYINENGSNYFWGTQPNHLFELIPSTDNSFQVTHKKFWEDLIEEPPRAIWFLNESNGIKWFAAHLSLKFVIIKQTRNQFEIFSEIDLAFDFDQNLFQPIFLKNKSVLFLQRKRWLFSILNPFGYFPQMNFLMKI